MNNISIKAKSSSGKAPYMVQFIFESGTMKVKCNCPAGRFGNFCKHKFGLLRGNDYWLHDEYDEDGYDNLQKIHAWVQKSDYLPLIIKGSKLQRAVDEAEAAMKGVRKDLATAMKKGLPGPE